MKYSDKAAKILNASSSIVVLLNLPIDKIVFNDLLKCDFSKNQNVRFNFMINSYDDFMNYEALNMNIDSNVMPYYNGENYNFFENYVFIRKEDLSESNLTRNDILVKSCINFNYWGKLIVQSDNKILLSNNTKPIGDINQSLRDILINAFDDESPWLKLRDSGPCENCAFNAICPPISDYNYYMVKYNLCSVRTTK